jgi:high-affinity nickel-transport protein
MSLGVSIRGRTNNGLPLADAPAQARTRGRVTPLYAVLIGANVAAWAWALIAFHRHPMLLGTALLAYGFGLRHAVDADHIAAIDNVTRKLMQQGKRPVSVGFCFSLGHSTVVFALSAAIALASVAVKNHFASLASVGGVIGTTVSAFFLLAIALANGVVLISVYRAFRRVRRGEKLDEEGIEVLLSQRGFLGRIFRSLFQLIEHGWQMYPVGFLFGLGFDTATEVGLLGISATEATKGLPIWSILVFPTLFAAGMALVDTTVNVLMLRAYGWAFVKPMRKLYYNLVITLVSVLVALVIGGIEVLGLLGDHWNIHGRVWEAIGSLNNNFGLIGFVIMGIFGLCWAASILYSRFTRYAEGEANIDPV